MAGQSKAKISRELKVAVNTVSSIVELSDIDKLFADGRVGTMQRVPEALKTLDIRLEKNSENAALWVLDKCFDAAKPQGQKMYGDTTLNQTLNVLLSGENASVHAGAESLPQSSGDLTSTGTKADNETRTVEVKAEPQE